MKRREFIALLGGAAAWPLAARAQQPVIGFLNGQRQSDFAHLAAAFRDGLNQGGYAEGRNVVVEYRWAEGQPQRVPALVAELISRDVAVLVHGGVDPRGAIAATGTIPIVTTFGGDPVRLGFAKSINRPGGNVTGASVFATDLEAKRFEMLRELLPGATLTGVLLDPHFSESAGQLQEIEAAARTLGKRISVLKATRQAEIEEAYDHFARMRVDCLLVTGSPSFNSQRNRIVALSQRFAIPTMQEPRESTVAGGLMSYGPSFPAIYRNLGLYAARVLKGEKPADLPILQPTKLELLVNLKTARDLGVTVPTSLLLRADEVIE